MQWVLRKLGFALYDDDIRMTALGRSNVCNSNTVWRKYFVLKICITKHEEAKSLTSF